MGTKSKDDALYSDCVDFFGSDEYDLVSSQDLLLMSEEELLSKQNDTTDNLFCKQMFSSIKQYKEEWDELYNNNELDFEILRKKSTEGQLRTSRFRSICWRCLLGILHKQPVQWLCQLKMYRKHYNEVYLELEQNPWNITENNPDDNPLSQESNSIWQKYFNNEELKTVVHQDVERTFPGMDFFRKDYIQQIMVRILFCYARQNPALCYRQGMHEILAPIVFVLYCDHQAFLHAREQSPELNEEICEILNPEYLEQDAYSIFKYVMNHIECSYRLNNIMTTSPGNFSAEILFENKACQNEVMLRLDFIKKNILQPVDPELSEHLQKLDIPLHLFGIRWLRLLFGREFLLQDLLVLWDFIFSNNFETVNFIVVAMLLAIRQILLNGDYTDCLYNLMRYPIGVDVTFIVNYALHLKDSEKYACPDNTKIQSLYQSACEKNKSCSKGSDIPSQVNSNKKREHKRLLWVSEKSNLPFLGETGDDDGSIVPGYATDDPDLIKVELEQARTILNVVHHKLRELHSVLTTYLQNNDSLVVQATLEGIFELSCLLKGYVKETGCEIETACEAGEIREPRTSYLNVTQKIKKIKPSDVLINDEKKSHSFAKVKRNLKSGELKVFKHQEGGIMKGGPMIDPLHLMKTLSLDEGLNFRRE